MKNHSEMLSLNKLWHNKCKMCACMWLLLLLSPTCSQWICTYAFDSICRPQSHTKTDRYQKKERERKRKKKRGIIFNLIHIVSVWFEKREREREHIGQINIQHDSLNIGHCVCVHFYNIWIIVITWWTPFNVNGFGVAIYTNTALIQMMNDKHCLSLNKMFKVAVVIVIVFVFFSFCHYLFFFSFLYSTSLTRSFSLLFHPNRHVWTTMSEMNHQYESVYTNIPTNTLTQFKCDLCIVNVASKIPTIHCRI